MKRLGDLWDKFCSVETATAAIMLGTQHKRNSRAVRRHLCYDKKTVREHPELRYELDPEKVKQYADAVVALIRSGEWRPKPYRHITKKSRTTGKVREIDCPTLQDHIIHWMLILAIKPAIMRGMYDYSCGSISGRGIEYARRTLEKWVRQRDSVYYVKLDVRKFYQSIDHGRLKAAFRRIIKDKRVLGAIDAIIESLPTGLAIGNYTSQWFANFYLQKLDHYILQELYKTRRGKRVHYVRHYLRYMDDLVLIGASKRDLEKAVRVIMAYAGNELGLTVKVSWEIKRFDKSALDAVGYRFTPESTTVRKVIFLHAKRLAKHIYRMKRKTGGIELVNAQAMESTIGWIKHADSKYFMRTYIEPYVNETEIKEVISHASNEQRIAAVPC